MKSNFLTFLSSFIRRFSGKKGYGYASRTILAHILRNKGLIPVVHTKSKIPVSLRCNLDDWIPWNVFLHGCYSKESGCEKCMINDSINAKCIFDVGANIGYYTLQFASLSQKVFAFEPLSYQVSELEKNLSLNHFTNVQITENIVSSTNDQLMRIYFSGINNSGKSSVEVFSERYEDKYSITLDSYCRQENISVIEIIKIDVEGHELNVLRGMHFLLTHKRVLKIYIEINQKTLAAANSSPEEVFSLLSSYGYRAYDISNGTRIARNDVFEAPLVMFSQK